MNYELIQAVAGIFVIIGVLAAIRQLKLSKDIAVTSFEDEVSREYRNIIKKKIPTKAILGNELSDEEFNEALDDIFSYIDLSNEEVFLCQQGRVRKKTWIYWCDGIQMNLEIPAFKKAWEIFKASDKDMFSELRRLEKSNFKDDPRKWK